MQTGIIQLKTCQDNFIIHKRKSNETIKQQDNCVFIEGDKENLTEA